MGNRRVLYDEEEEGGNAVASGMEDDDESMEAEVADSDEDVNEVENDEEEEGQDEYEDDGFIVNEDEDEDGRPDEPRQKKKKKKKIDSEKNFVLDEDDYVLLEDNNVLGIRRPKTGTKKFKRLKKAGKDTDPRVHSDFFDEDGLLLDDIDDDEAKSKYDDEDVVEEDEMDGFIVHAEETEGHPVRKLKRKSMQEYGVSSSAAEEAHDIFGDPNEYLNRRKKRLARIDRFDNSGRQMNMSLEGSLKNEYEPFILTEKYLTEKDDLIRNIDVPERIQISEECTGPASVDIMSIKEETSWILSQLTANITWFCKMKVMEGNDEGLDLLKNVEQEIERFLKLHHVEKYDIPFIAMYRKELCLSLLKDPEQNVAENEDEDETKRTPRLKRNKILWAIKDLDRKWLLLRKRKNALQLYYNKRYEEESLQKHDEARLNLNKELFESIVNSLKNAESEREVDDVDLKFNLHFPLDEVNVSQGQFKRPKRRSHYSICSNAGLQEVAAKFGCNSEQFGLQVTLVNVRREDLEDLKESPEEIASTFTGHVFETPQAVLKGARHMAAVEISSEPCFRKHVQSIFMDEAVVSTRPTPKGNMVIDPSHEFSGFKWLHGKPLSQFKDAQWLLIQRAEEEKLLEVTIKLPESTLNKLTSESNDCYLSDGVSISARLWNEQRKLILQVAFSNFLLPYMEKQARVLLTARAKAWLLEEYGKQLWNRVSVAPYQHKENDDEIDKETAPRVMACCWGPGNPATTFVMLDSLGEVMDVLHASSLIIQSWNNQKQQQQKKIDQERVREFMTEHQPHVVVLGAVNLACRRLKEEIYEIIFKMMEENPRDVGQEMDGIRIVYGDESLPRIYEHSRISSDQLPGQPGIVKRAVALGRFLQNPLAMIATLCGPGKEMLSWKLGSLDYLLTADDKYEMVEQVMVDVTNQVGIDINLAATHDWLFAPLQFVSGLGPRKAGCLQRALVRIGAVTCRKKLIDHGLGTMSVFRNAVGFLRVRCCGMVSSSSDMDLLDDTRIHPESYSLAKILAKEVYKCFENDEIDDVVLEMAIGYVRNHPKYLEDLKIFEYAKDYEIKHGKSKRETLYDIKMELLHGFQDWRNPYEEPSEDEEFHMITGENGDTLAEGKIVQATVRLVQPERVFCVLDSGLDGILFKDGFSDERDEIDLTTKLQVGEILICKIKQIEKNRHRVVLTCKEIQSRSSKYQNSHSVDPYYCEDQSSFSQEQEKAQKELAKKHFKPRMIVHPHFQNITLEEAMEYLSDKAVGESTFHPSSRGSSYLSLTLKIYNGVYAHKEITEGGKDQKDAMSLLHLGKTLKIGDENFEDLDEVMDRYVEQLVTHLKAMLNYRKFRRGKKAEVDDLLRAEKSNYPMRIVYCFGICHEHPGAFILSYIRNTNPHHEYIGLYPKGFKFRQHTFNNIDRLVAYFQKHINDPRPGQAPSIQSVAAMVPMRSPACESSVVGAPTGGGWESSTGGWRGQFNSSRDKTCTSSSRGGNENRSGGNGGDGWSSFPGAEVLNSPGREASPAGWGSSSGRAGAGNLGGGGSTKSWGSSGIGNWVDGESTRGQGSFGVGNWGHGRSTHDWGGSNRGGAARGSNWGGAMANGRGNGSQGCGNNGYGRGHGHGRGRGRGSYNAKDQKEFGYGAGSEWGLVPNVEGKSWGGDGWSNLSGLKVQNPPIRAALSGGWGSLGRGKASDNNEGGGGGTGGWGNEKASGGNGGGSGEAGSSGPCTWGNGGANWGRVSNSNSNSHGDGTGGGGSSKGGWGGSGSDGGWGSWGRSKASDNNEGGGGGTGGWGNEKASGGNGGGSREAGSSGPCTWGNGGANWRGISNSNSNSRDGGGSSKGGWGGSGIGGGENKSNADGDVAWDAACSKGNCASDVANSGWDSGKSNTNLPGGGNGWSGGSSGGW